MHVTKTKNFLIPHLQSNFEDFYDKLNIRAKTKTNKKIQQHINNYAPLYIT